MAEIIYKMVACHAIGDYVLQNDFLAKTKGNNWWHLIIHCILYSVPFTVCFGLDWLILYLIGTHIVIDATKARYSKINYVMDQVFHFIILAAYAVIVYKRSFK